jgi:hypothetical protein
MVNAFLHPPIVSVFCTGFGDCPKCARSNFRSGGPRVGTFDCAMQCPGCNRRRVRSMPQYECYRGASFDYAAYTMPGQAYDAATGIRAMILIRPLPMDAI